jgi:hypothetical protein
MKFSHVVLRCLLIFPLAAGIASADVVYSFSGTSYGFSEAFQYTAPSFIPDNIPTGIDITKWILLTPAQLDSCTNCGWSYNGAPVWFEPNATDGQGGPPAFDDVRFFGNDSSLSLFRFPLGAFSTPGIYHTVPEVEGGNIATLQVGAVPEPSSRWLLVSFVSLMIGLTARRRYRSRV